MKPTVILTMLIALAQPNTQPDKKGAPPPDGLKALKHPDADVRYKAAAVLVKLGPVGKFAVPELRETLKDTNGFVRVKAAEALWAIDKKTPTTLLLPVLLQALADKNADLRSAAATVIGQLGPKAKSAVPALIAALADKDDGVRLNVILALGDLGAPAREAAPALLELVRDSDKGAVAPFVTTALANLGPDIVPVLTKALADKMTQRRRVAGEALALMGTAAGPALSALTAALADDDAPVREFAARALGNIGADAKSAAPELTKRLADPGPFVRMEAVLALWRVAGKAEVAAIAKLAADKDELVRQAAARTLGHIGPPAASAAESLRPLLMDELPAIRLAAAVAWWRVTGKGEPSVAVFTEGLKDKDAFVRRQAAEQVGDLGAAAKALVPLLVETLQDDDAVVRDATKQALKKIDPEAAKKAGVR